MLLLVSCSYDEMSKMSAQLPIHSAQGGDFGTESPTLEPQHSWQLSTHIYCQHDPSHATTRPQKSEPRLWHTVVTLKQPTTPTFNCRRIHILIYALQMICPDLLLALVRSRSGRRHCTPTKPAPPCVLNMSHMTTHIPHIQ